jgi:hypothetical protein
VPGSLEKKASIKEGSFFPLFCLMNPAQKRNAYKRLTYPDSLKFGLFLRLTVLLQPKSKGKGKY